MKFGIIGLGVISHRFTRVLKSLGEENLYACAARDLDRANAYKEKYGFKKAYSNYDDLINDPEVEAIYIALTHNFHFEITKKCILNHKPVICEKPFLLTEKEATEIDMLRKTKNVLVMEALWTRFTPLSRKAKAIIDAKILGDILLLEADFCVNVPYDESSRLFNKELAGGSLYDIGVYSLGYMVGLIDQDIKNVQSMTKYYPNKADATSIVNLEFESGILGKFTCTFTYAKEKTAYVYGTKGKMVIENFPCSHLIKVYDKDNNEIYEENLKVEDGFIYQIEHFINLVENGKLDSELMPFSDVIREVKVFDSVLKTK